MWLLESLIHSVGTAVAALVACILFLEYILFPLVSLAFQKIIPDSYGNFDNEHKSKTLNCVVAILIRFGGFSIASAWTVSNVEIMETIYCGFSPEPNLILALLLCFTIHCALFLTESFSPRFRVKVTPISWLHHIAMWVNWILYVPRNMDDPITLSLGFMYGTLIPMFAWSDTLQVLRYLSKDPSWRFYYFRTYYWIRWLQFIVFSVVPLAWVHIAYFQKSCLSKQQYIVITSMACVIKVPNLVLVVGQMRKILLHYKQQHIESKQGTLPTTTATTTTTTNDKYQHQQTLSSSTMNDTTSATELVESQEAGSSLGRSIDNTTEQIHVC